MKRLLILLPALLLLGGCAGQKPAKRSIESISANTGAAMSSYPTASSVVAGDKALISKSTASNATQQAAMSTIKSYVLAELPAIVFGTGLTVAEDYPSDGTDTISVTANTYQAYDADLTTWAGVTPGTGVAAAIAANTGQVGGLPTVIASGAYTVDTASINANTCASAVAVPASGVITTDTIIATPNAILSSVTGFGVTTAGAVRVDVYPTDTDGGKVNFQFCNPTGATIDPGSVTFNWKVIR